MYFTHAPQSYCGNLNPKPEQPPNDAERSIDAGHRECVQWRPDVFLEFVAVNARQDSNKAFHLARLSFRDPCLPVPCSPPSSFRAEGRFLGGTQDVRKQRCQPGKSARLGSDKICCRRHLAFSSRPHDVASSAHPDALTQTTKPMIQSRISAAKRPKQDFAV